MPQPPQSFPHGGIGWFWQATDNVPHGGFGWFWLTTANVPHGGVGWSTYSERDRNTACFAGERDKGDNRRLAAGAQCAHGCSPSHGDGPAPHGFHRYGPGDPAGPLVHPTGVGHSLGTVFPPTFYGQYPLPHTGTAALLSLAAAAVLPTAASHPGPDFWSPPATMPFGPGSAPQPQSSGAPHRLSAPGGGGGGGGGPHPRPRAPLSAGLHGSSPLCSRGNLWHLDPCVIAHQSPTVTLPRGQNGMEPLRRAWVSCQPTSSSGPSLARCRS